MLPKCATYFGDWRSLVAHLLWEQRVVGSSPASPTNKETTMIYLTLITALTIAGVAAWYSIIGLMTIFAGAAIPIAIMGGTLEVGKLVTASWLHQNWKRAPLLMKTYLTTAVATLMIITSLGIFGFLSKAHVEQVGETAQAGARVERIDDKILRFEGRVQITEEKIARIGGSTSSLDSVESSISRQEEVINSAWDRIGDSIESEEAQMESLRGQLDTDIRVQQDRVGVAQSRVQEDVLVKERSIERIRDEIKSMDEEVRSLSDKGIETGAFGAVKKDWTEDARNLRAEQQPRRERLNQQLGELDADISNLREKEIEVSDEVQIEIGRLRAALLGDLKPYQDKIDQLRLSAQAEVDEANAEIKRLQSQLGDKESSTDSQVSVLEAEIDGYYAEIDTLREEKFDLESSVRDLEAEVGPLKYIAELIYGDEATQHFDEAVRWVIILLIITFDPLAIVLLLAANMGFSDRKRSKMLEFDPNNVVDAEKDFFVEPENTSCLSEEVPEEWEEKVDHDLPSGDEISDYEVLEVEEDEGHGVELDPTDMIEPARARGPSLASAPTIRKNRS